MEDVDRSQAEAGRPNAGEQDTDGETGARFDTRSGNVDRRPLTGGGATGVATGDAVGDPGLGRGSMAPQGAAAG